MKTFLPSLFSTTLFCVLLFATGYVQAQLNSAKSVSDQSSSKKDLFENNKTLQITLTGNIHEVMNDRVDNPKSHPLILSYKTEKGNEDSLYIQVRTRGHFRKSMGSCTYPLFCFNLPPMTACYLQYLAGRGN